MWVAHLACQGACPARSPLAHGRKMACLRPPASRHALLTICMVVEWKRCQTCHCTNGCTPQLQGSPCDKLHTQFARAHPPCTGPRPRIAGIEDLRDKRESIIKQINDDEAENASIQQELQALTRRHTAITDSLARKVRRTGCEGGCAARPARRLPPLHGAAVHAPLGHLLIELHLMG